MFKMKYGAGLGDTYVGWKRADRWQPGAGPSRVGAGHLPAGMGPMPGMGTEELAVGTSPPALDSRGARDQMLRALRASLASRVWPRE